MDAKKLKEYRKKHNLTQKEMAVELGISRKTLNNYENGGNIPLAKEIMIEKIYGTTHYSNNEVLSHATNTQGDNNIYINNSQNALTDKETQSIPVQANENNIYTEMIATQRELITNQNELISQYRKEIEYLRQKVKEYREKYEK